MMVRGKVKCPKCGGEMSEGSTTCMNCRQQPLPATAGRDIQIYNRWQNGEYQADLADYYNLSRQRIGIIIQTVEQWKREGRA